MLIWYGRLICKVIILGLMGCAASLWISAGTRSRRRSRELQVFLGGTVWSQLLITTGLIISLLADEDVSVFMQSYFIVVGLGMLLVTGVLLIVLQYIHAHEDDLHSSTTSTSSKRSNPPIPIKTYQDTYCWIAAFCLIAALFTTIDFLLLIL